MKIVVQTGEHIGRKEIEYFISKSPSAWKCYFETIVIFGSREEDLRISFNEKEKALGVHTPSSYKGTSSDILEEMAVSLVAIKNIGRLPKKLSPSKRTEYKEQWKAIQENG